MNQGLFNLFPSRRLLTSRAVGRVLTLLGGLSVCLVWIANPAWGATYSNSTTITIPSSGPASLFPSSISVANLPGTISNISVTLPQFTHFRPDDLDIMLVGPSPQGGQTNVMLMSDAGGDQGAFGLRLVFSNIVTATTSPFPPDSGQLVSRAYRPINYETTSDVFPQTSWTAPFNTNLAVFNGANPNGTWRLYVVDDTGQNTGSIVGGWQLTLETQVLPATITDQPDDITVLRGGTAIFQVAVTGTPPFGYQWFRNGVPIAGANASSYAIQGVDACDVGGYSVRVTSPGSPNGVASRVASLKVVGTVEICEQDLNRTLRPKPGEDVELRPTVSGDPPLRYQWTLNGMVLTNETNAVLLLKSVQARSGGEFALIIWNGNDAITRTIATVAVDAATGPAPTDDFRDRPFVENLQGVLQGNSEKATIEPGEPVQPGGGRTMWFQWQAPNTGIATLSMLGSSFDTMLRVFPVGNGVLGPPLTRDDDRAGFYTSEFQFNVERGRAYAIQIDGFGRNSQGEFGDGGEFTISYGMEVSQEIVPVIVSEPQPVAVQPGQPAFFRVVVAPPDVDYQWFFNGGVLEGEISDTLSIPRALSKHVGFYFVRIKSREFRREVNSFPVDLQLSSVSGVLVQDKFERLFLSSGGNGGNQEAGAPAGGLFTAAASGGGLASGFIAIGLGNSLFHEAASIANRQTGDPNPCGSPFVGTLWQGLAATNTGKILVSTEGSSIFARLAVYRLTGGIADFTQPPLVCDLTSALAGQPCHATFDAGAGTNYTIVVEGYQTSGVLRVTTTMGFAPPPISSLVPYLVPQDGSIQLSMPATNWFPQPICQWYFNGAPLVNETNATLLVSGFNESLVGDYSVWMSNFVSSTTCNVAHLDLAPPFTLQYLWTTNGGAVGFSIVASNSASFAIESTTNLNNPWLPVVTNIEPWAVLRYTNTFPFADPQRFFRAVPWSP